MPAHLTVNWRVHQVTNAFHKRLLPLKSSCRTSQTETAWKRRGRERQSSGPSPIKPHVAASRRALLGLCQQGRVSWAVNVSTSLAFGSSAREETLAPFAAAVRVSCGVTLFRKSRLLASAWCRSLSYLLISKGSRSTRRWHCSHYREISAFPDLRFSVGVSSAG